MTDWYEIWLYSTNTYIEPDSDSMVALTSMPTEAQTVAEPIWTKIKVAGLERDRVPIREPEERNGIIVHCTTQIEQFNLKILPFLFPEDRENLDDLYDIFLKQYIFLSIHGNDSTYQYNDDFHDSTECMAVSLKSLPKPEHNYDEGYKVLKVELQRFFPIYGS